MLNLISHLNSLDHVCSQISVVIYKVLGLCPVVMKIENSAIPRNSVYGIRDQHCMDLACLVDMLQPVSQNMGFE